MPDVLNIAIHINHANWLFLADFQKEINFKIDSNIAKTAIIMINHKCVCINCSMILSI